MSCRSGELGVHCFIRQRAGGNVVNLSVLRGYGHLFDDWLRAAPSSNEGGCPFEPPDGTPLRVHVHGEDMEFGYELVQLMPYAHAACLHGVLELRSYCQGMRPFYFFASKLALLKAAEVQCRRDITHEIPGGTWSMRAQHARPVGRFWERHPAYRQHYHSPAWRHTRSALVLAKQGIAGVKSFMPSGVRNTWSMPGLIALLQQLNAHADRVVYFRAGAALPPAQTGDVGPNAYNDTAEIRARAPNVTFLQDMVARGPGYANRLNEMQLVLAATAQVTVATQGGAAVLSSLAAERLVILCRVGQECHGRPPDVTWWRRLNNATVVIGADEAALAREAVRMLRPPRSTTLGSTKLRGREAPATDIRR